jgi:uncharacterized alpha-E superfamily protein
MKTFQNYLDNLNENQELRDKLAKETWYALSEVLSQVTHPEIRRAFIRFMHEEVMPHVKKFLS